MTDHPQQPFKMMKTYISQYIFDPLVRGLIFFNYYISSN